MRCQARRSARALFASWKIWPSLDRSHEFIQSPRSMRPAIWTLAVVSGLFCLLVLLERAFPLRQRSRAVLGRLLINLAISALAFFIAAILVRPAALGALNWSAEKSFGIV